MSHGTDWMHHTSTCPVKSGRQGSPPFLICSDCRNDPPCNDCAIQDETVALVDELNVPVAHPHTSERQRVCLLGDWLQGMYPGCTCRSRPSTAWYRIDPRVLPAVRFVGRHSSQASLPPRRVRAKSSIEWGAKVFCSDKKLIETLVCAKRRNRLKISFNSIGRHLFLLLGHDGFPWFYFCFLAGTWRKQTCTDTRPTCTGINWIRSSATEGADGRKKGKREWRPHGGRNIHRTRKVEGWIVGGVLGG